MPSTVKRCSCNLIFLNFVGVRRNSRSSVGNWLGVGGGFKSQRVCNYYAYLNLQEWLPCSTVSVSLEAEWCLKIFAFLHHHQCDVIFTMRLCTAVLWSGPKLWQSKMIRINSYSWGCCCLEVALWDVGRDRRLLASLAPSPDFLTSCRRWCPPVAQTPSKI